MFTTFFLKTAADVLGDPIPVSYNGSHYNPMVKQMYTPLDSAAVPDPVKRTAASVPPVHQSAASPAVHVPVVSSSPDEQKSAASVALSLELVECSLNMLLY